MVIDRPKQFWLGIVILLGCSFGVGNLMSAPKQLAEAEEPRFTQEEVLRDVGYNQVNVHLITDKKTGAEFVLFQSTYGPAKSVSAVQIERTK